MEPLIDKIKGLITLYNIEYKDEERLTLIPEWELNRYQNAEAMLLALEAAGVDNWQGYGDALQDYWGAVRAS